MCGVLACECVEGCVVGVMIVVVVGASVWVKGRERERPDFGQQQQQQQHPLTPPLHLENQTSRCLPTTSPTTLPPSRALPTQHLVPLPSLPLPPSLPPQKKTRHRCLPTTSPTTLPPSRPKTATGSAGRLILAQPSRLAATGPPCCASAELWTRQQQQWPRNSTHQVWRLQWMRQCKWGAVWLCLFVPLLGRGGGGLA